MELLTRPSPQEIRVFALEGAGQKAQKKRSLHQKLFEIVSSKLVRDAAGTIYGLTSCNDRLIRICL